MTLTQDNKTTGGKPKCMCAYYGGDYDKRRVPNPRCPVHGKTQIDFPCPYTVEQRYDMVCSGEYGVFEMYDNYGDVVGYRGYRKEHGTTGVYDSYRAALEAAFIEFGDKHEST